MTSPNIDKQIEQIQKEAAAKIAKLKATAAHIPDDIKEMATILHDIYCRHNHIDACDWYYAKYDWSAHARQVYLAKATQVKKEIPELTPAKCATLYQILKSYNV